MRKRNNRELKYSFKKNINGSLENKDYFPELQEQEVIEAKITEEDKTYRKSGYEVQHTMSRNFAKKKPRQ